MKLAERGQAASWRSGSPPTGRATRPQQRREIEARLCGRRAARRRRHRRARARDRRRRARRRDLRHLPRHGRQPAADVGAGGPAPPRPRRLRRRRGRARPVLLPPPRRVPRAPGRGGDPRPRKRADRSSRHLLAAAYELPLGEPRTTRSSAPGWRERAERLVGGRASCAAAAARATCRATQRVRRRPRSRCARPRPTRSRCRARLGRDARHWSRPSAPSRRSTPARSTCTWAAPTRSSELDIDGRRAIVSPLRRRLVHAAEEGDRGLHRADARAAARRSGSSCTSARSRSREQVIAFQRKRLGRQQEVIDIVALDLPEQDFVTQALWYVLPDRLGGGAAARGPARRPARHRARPDRGAAADRDVRPLGHRRPLDQRPLPDRPADDLHLRRPSRRGRDHPARLRASSSAWSPTPTRLIARVPLRRRLPLLRAEPEVRQPQRAPAQGGRARADGADAGRAERDREAGSLRRLRTERPRLPRPWSETPVPARALRRGTRRHPSRRPRFSLRCHGPWPQSWSRPQRHRRDR